MQDFLVAVIIGWIIFRLFRPVVFIQWNKPQNHYHNYRSNTSSPSSEGEIKVTESSPQRKSNNSNDEGEYIDFEELPKS